MDVCSANNESSENLSGFSELSKEPPDCGFSNPDSANYESSENVNGFSELSNETPDCVFSNPEELCVHDLGCQFTEFLNIQHDEYTTEKNNSNMLKEDGSKDIHQDGTGSEASEKCLIKCATFPCSFTSTPPAELVYGEEPEDGTSAAVKAHKADAASVVLPHSRSTSLPTPLKLVSALKGSREKVGRPSRNLTVTWAPDVYDPVPTAESHVPNKGHRHRSDNKKYAKSKQKSSSKSSRGSKGKDKKQPRRHGGSSKRSSHFLDENNITCSSELQTSILDFDISSPDPFCGSSFLRKSVTKLHFPVAEAT